MPGNKFSEGSPATRSPSYCYKGPIPALPIFPIGKPPFVKAWAHWADRDPLAYTDVSAYISLPKITDRPIYHGYGFPPDYTFAITLEKALATDLWTVVVTLVGLYRPPPGESQWWENIKIQTDPTIDTGLLTFVHLPGKDFRKCRIMQ